MTHRRTLTALVALAVVAMLGLAGCGGGSKSDSASAKKKGTGDIPAASDDGAATAPDETGATDTKDDAAVKTDGKTPAGTDAKPGATATAGATTTTLPPELAKELEQYKGDWIAGSPMHISNDEPRPPNCGFKVGEMCQLRVQGAYGLKTVEVAKIHVGAYDDDHTKADFEVTLPNAKKPGTRWYVDKFPYSARPGVKKTTILVRLLDAQDKELARGKPTTYDFEFLRSH